MYYEIILGYMQSRHGLDGVQIVPVFASCLSASCVWTQPLVPVPKNVFIEQRLRVLSSPT